MKEHKLSPSKQSNQQKITQSQTEIFTPIKKTLSKLKFGIIFIISFSARNSASDGSIAVFLSLQNSEHLISPHTPTLVSRATALSLDITVRHNMAHEHVNLSRYLKAPSPERGTVDFARFLLFYIMLHLFVRLHFCI